MSMKKFIKILTVVLVLACVFSLTACKPKNNEEQNNNGVEQTTAAPTPTGFDLPDEDLLLPVVTATPGATGGSGDQGSSQNQNPNVTSGTNATPTPTLAPGQTPVPTPTLAPGQSPAPTTPVPTQAPTPTSVTLPFDPFH